MDTRQVCLILLSFISTIAVLNPLLFASPHAIVDDAFIYFRYVENLMGAGELTWNIGMEKVEGYTSFLYTMILTFPAVLNLDLEHSAHLINLSSYGVVLFLVGVFSLFAFGKHQTLRYWPAIFVGPILLGASAQFANTARNGMESMVFALAMTLALLAVAWQRTSADKQHLKLVVSGLCYGLLTLARPEGALLFAVCLLYFLREGRWRVPAFKRESIRLLGFMVLFGSHMAWRVYYYGEFLPNTAYAKVSFARPVLLDGLIGFSGFLSSWRGALMVSALVLWVIAPKSATGNLLVLTLLAFVAYLTFIVGLPDWNSWYTPPLDLLTAMTFGWSVVCLTKGFSLGSPETVQLALLTGLLAIGSFWPQLKDMKEWPSLSEVDLSDKSRSGIYDFALIGGYLRRIAAPGETIAVGAAGLIPYYSGLVSYDTLGINDKYIARQPVGANDHWRGFAHKKGSGTYIMAKKPTYLITNPFLTDQPDAHHIRFEKTFEEMVQLPEFNETYEFYSVPIGKWGFFNFYKLRPQYQVQAH